jgi:hypothetical protein
MLHIELRKHKQHYVSYFSKFFRQLCIPFHATLVLSKQRYKKPVLQVKNTLQSQKFTIFFHIRFRTKTYFSLPLFNKKPILMKSIFFACFLIISSVAIAQDKTCNLWLGETSDSTNNIKQFAEKYLEIQTKLMPGASNNIQEMRDDNDLAQIKVWLKPQKTLVKGAMSTVYTISSYKIVSLSNKIDELYNALVNKVKGCSSETTAMNTLFGNNKMFIERNSGGFGKKGLQMSTLTVTAK